LLLESLTLTVARDNPMTRRQVAVGQI